MAVTRLMLDSCCLIAAQEPSDAQHTDCVTLIEFGRSPVELVPASQARGA